MGVLGFMMAFNVVYYQFSISAATILFLYRLLITWFWIRVAIRRSSIKR
jgi:ABC-type transport system involved in Fe-S cluster assembly fused permease/ATPase subunit